MLGVVATRDDHHLLMLFVAEEAQGQGLARALWARAREACLEAGYSGVFTVSAALGLCRSTRGSVSWRAVR